MVHLFNSRLMTNTSQRADTLYGFGFALMVWAYFSYFFFTLFFSIGMDILVSCDFGDVYMV
jgi:hypothetical protein